MDRTKWEERCCSPLDFQHLKETLLICSLDKWLYHRSTNMCIGPGKEKGAQHTETQTDPCIHTYRDTDISMYTALHIQINRLRDSTYEWLIESLIDLFCQYVHGVAECSSALLTQESYLSLWAGVNWWTLSQIQTDEQSRKGQSNYEIQIILQQTSATADRQTDRHTHTHTHRHGTETHTYEHKDIFLAWTTLSLLIDTSNVNRQQIAKYIKCSCPLEGQMK